MATIVNDRDVLLQAASTRLIATSVSIITDNGSFTKPKNGAAITPASINLTASPSVFTSPTYEWFYANSLAPTTWTSLGSGATKNITSSAYTTHKSTGTYVSYKVTATQTGFLSANSTRDIQYYVEADDPIIVSITRPSVTVPADNSGVVTGPVANTGVVITVSRGGTLLNYGASGAGTFSVATGAVTPTSAITLGTATGAGTTYTVANIASMQTAQETASVSWTVTARDLSGTALPTIDITQSVLKVRAGASGTAKTIGMSASGYIFRANAVNTIVEPSYITLSANKQGTTGTVTWGTSPAVTLYDAPTGGSITTTGDTVYMRSGNYGSNTSVVVTATIAADSLTDTCTIARIRDGASNITIVLSNPAAQLSADSAGTVSSYAGSGTTIQVYEGSTARTMTGCTTTVTYGTITAGSVSGTNSTTVTIGTHSGMSTTTAIIKYTLTVTLGDGTSTTYYGYQTLSKSLQGTTGNTGATGATGTSSRRAYKVTSNQTPPTSVTAGTGDVAPTNDSQGNGAWSFTASTPGSNQWLHQVDGLYPNTGNITWGVPYLASFKVGTLEALTVNTGNLTASGAITVSSAGHIKGGQTDYDTGTGFFLGYSSTTYKLSIGNASGNKIIWDGSTLQLNGPVKATGLHSAPLTVKAAITGDITGITAAPISQNCGVYGYCASNGGGGSGFVYGVYGQSSGNGIGLYGTSATGIGISGVGVANIGIEGLGASTYADINCSNQKKLGFGGSSVYIRYDGSYFRVTDSSGTDRHMALIAVDNTDTLSATTSTIYRRTSNGTSTQQVWLAFKINGNTYYVPGFN